METEWVQYQKDKEDAGRTIGRIKIREVDGNKGETSRRNMDVSHTLTGIASAEGIVAIKERLNERLSTTDDEIVTLGLNGHTFTGITSAEGIVAIKEEGVNERLSADDDGIVTLGLNDQRIDNDEDEPPLAILPVQHTSTTPNTETNIEEGIYMPYDCHYDNAFKSNNAASSNRGLVETIDDNTAVAEANEVVNKGDNMHLSADSVEQVNEDDDGIAHHFDIEEGLHSPSDSNIENDNNIALVRGNVTGSGIDLIANEGEITESKFISAADDNERIIDNSEIGIVRGLELPDEDDNDVPLPPFQTAASYGNTDDDAAAYDEKYKKKMATRIVRGLELPDEDDSDVPLPPQTAAVYGNTDDDAATYDEKYKKKMARSFVDNNVESTEVAVENHPNEELGDNQNPDEELGDEPLPMYDLPPVVSGSPPVESMVDNSDEDLADNSIADMELGKSRLQRLMSDFSTAAHSIYPRRRESTEARSANAIGTNSNRSSSNNGTDTSSLIHDDGSILRQAAYMSSQLQQAIGEPPSPTPSMLLVTQPQGAIGDASVHLSADTQEENSMRNVTEAYRVDDTLYDATPIVKSRRKRNQKYINISLVLVVLAVVITTITTFSANKLPVPDDLRSTPPNQSLPGAIDMILGDYKQTVLLDSSEYLTKEQVNIYELIMESYTANIGVNGTTSCANATSTVIKQEFVGENLLALSFTMQYESQNGTNVEGCPSLFDEYINDDLEQITDDMQTQSLPVIEAMNVTLNNTYTSFPPTNGPSEADSSSNPPKDLTVCFLMFINALSLYTCVCTNNNTFCYSSIIRYCLHTPRQQVRAQVLCHLPLRSIPILLFDNRVVSAGLQMSLKHRQISVLLWLKILWPS